MADSNVRVVYTVVDKNCPDDNHPVYGNELYVDTTDCNLSPLMRSDFVPIAIRACRSGSSSFRTRGCRSST